MSMVSDFKKSFDSNDAWHKMNKYGADRLIKWSLPIIISGLVSLVILYEDNIFFIFIFSAFPLIVLIPAHEYYKYSKEL